MIICLSILGWDFVRGEQLQCGQWKSKDYAASLSNESQPLQGWGLPGKWDEGKNLGFIRTSKMQSAEHSLWLLSQKSTVSQPRSDWNNMQHTWSHLLLVPALLPFKYGGRQWSESPEFALVAFLTSEHMKVSDHCIRGRELGFQHSDKEQCSLGFFYALHPPVISADWVPFIGWMFHISLYLYIWHKTAE